MYFYQNVFKMGYVYAELELVNENDTALAKAYVIGQEEVRKITVNALVVSFKHFHA